MKEVNVGVGIIILSIPENKILLGKRSKKHSHGVNTWCSPGGHIEFGETPEDAITRETFEEVGLKVRSLRYIGFTNDVFKKEEKHYITLWFETNIFTGKIKDTDELKNVAWFSIKKLPKLLFLSTENYLKKFEKYIYYKYN